MKRTARIYKGLEVQKESGELYKIDQITAGGTVAAHMFDFEKEEYEKETAELLKSEVARDLGADVVIFELTTEEKKAAIEEAGLSILTGKELNELDRDQDGNKLNRHFDAFYYVADNAGKLKTWEQAGSYTEAEAIDEAVYMIDSGDLD